MKDFDYYSKPKIKYPDRKFYTTIYVYHKGKVLDTIPLQFFKHENYPNDVTLEKEFDSDKYKKDVNKYYEETSRLHEEFKNDLFEDFNVMNNPKKDKCFELAWEYGQSAGYEDVYVHFDNLVELIK